MLLSTCITSQPFTKPPLTPELPRKGLKNCFKRCSSTDATTTQMQPMTAVDEYKLNQPCLSSNVKEKSPVYICSRCSCDECVTLFTHEISRCSRKDIANCTDHIHKESKICQKHFSNKINIDFSSAEDQLSDAHQTIDRVSVALLHILKQNCKTRLNQFHEISKHTSMNNHNVVCGCRRIYDDDGDKEIRKESDKTQKKSKRIRNSIIPRIEIIDESAIDDQYNNATFQNGTEGRSGRYETYVSLPCSPITSPPPNRRRPFSARTGSTINIGNSKTGNRLLDRRSTLGTTKLFPKTFDQWLLEKSREKRRQSLADVVTNSERHREKEYRLRERLVHEKTFDEWMREKNEAQKLRCDNRRVREEDKRKQKLEQAEEHEKLSERIYNEWLLKKFNQELSIEMKLLQQIRCKKDKKKTSFPSIVEKAAAEDLVAGT